MLFQIQVAHPALIYGLNELVKHITPTNTPTTISLALDIPVDMLQHQETHHLQDILSDTREMEWTFDDQCLHFPAKLP